MHELLIKVKDIVSKYFIVEAMSISIGYLNESTIYYQIVVTVKKYRSINVSIGTNFHSYNEKEILEELLESLTKKVKNNCSHEAIAEILPTHQRDFKSIDEKPKS